MVQQTIINEEITLTKGTTLEYLTTLADPGQVNFTAGDILTMSLTQTKGNQTVTLRYHDTAGGDADSRLTHPGEAAAAFSVSDVATLAESIAAELGITRTEKATLAESTATDLGLTRTELATLVESIETLLGRNVLDIASLLDSVAIVTGQGISSTDTATLAESIGAQLGLSRTETASLAESIQSALSKGSGSGVSLSDSVTFPHADLSVVNQRSSGPVRSGDHLIYTLTITNNSPSPATEVILTDSLPLVVVFVSVTHSQGVCRPFGGTVTCELGTITSGNSATVTIRVLVGPFIREKHISITSRVKASEPDTDTTNNTAIEKITVVQPLLPTPTPLPPLTVVPEEEIEPVEPQAGIVEIVHPTTPATLELPTDGVKLKIPGPVQQETFQVRLQAPAPDYLGVPPDGQVLRPIQIDLFDVHGDPMQDVLLWSSAQLSVTLTEADVQELGGLGSMLFEVASGRLHFQRFNPSREGGYWTSLHTSLDITGRVLSTSVSRFSTFALVWSNGQPTPSPTPIAPATGDTPILAQIAFVLAVLGALLLLGGGVLLLIQKRNA